MFVRSVAHPINTMPRRTRRDRVRAKQHDDETGRRDAEATHSQRETMRQRDEMRQHGANERRRVNQRIIQRDGRDQATR